MEIEGTLKIKKVRRGLEHTVEFVNQRGRTVNFPVHEDARYYNIGEEGSHPCKIEVAGSTVIKCVVPGREAEPKRKEPKQTAETSGGGYGGGRKGSYAGGGGGNYYGGSGGNPKKSPPVLGTAPYNFVEYKVDAIVPPAEGEARKWSGDIICELKALKPLLVSGKQGQGDGVAAACHFMQVNGQNMIPGTSIKGMLRSLVEILSFSGLRPVSKKKLFWRTVAEGTYRDNFPKDVIWGGFLRGRGAEYELVPVDITPRDADAQKTAGYVKVSTGGIMVKGKKSKSYFFKIPGPKAAALPIDREIVARFFAQLTENQKGRWKGRTLEEMIKSPEGLPVFYRGSENSPVEIGLCRYFRIEYKYSPHELAWPNGGDEEKPDMARAIFGHVGRESRAGHVSIAPFAIQGNEYAPAGVKIVQSSPKPTCLGFYIDQTERKIGVISGGRKNEKTTMANYNEKTSRLRGHKLYWHHDVPAELPRGNDNENTLSSLHPLAAGATGEFVIHVDHLTDTELGCLFEALELKPGCAHKLGMGRAAGFGSVKIGIKAANIVDATQKNRSLADRLSNTAPSSMDEAKRAELREIFRKHVFAHIGRAWQGATNFYALPPIRDLFVMLDYQHRPAPQAVATLPLQKFRDNPLLPKPEEVLGGTGR